MIQVGEVERSRDLISLTTLARCRWALPFVVNFTLGGMAVGNRRDGSQGSFSLSSLGPGGDKLDRREMDTGAVNALSH